MADKPKPGGESSSSDGHTFAYAFIIAIIFILGIGNYVDQSGIPFVDNEQGREFSLSAFIPQGEITSGKKIANRKATVVRRDPGGFILGEQEKRAKGIVKEGPTEAFDETWWYIQYENAPSGWVIGDTLSTWTKLLATIGVVSAMLTLSVPLAIIAIVLIIVTVIVLTLRANHLVERNTPKNEVVDDLQPVREEPILSTAEKIAKSSANKTEENTSAPLGAVPGNLPTGDLSGLEFVQTHQHKEKEIPEGVRNPRWQHVKVLASSHNINDWKQAIIEADIILDDMLEKMGYEGKSIGDRLKNVEPSDFTTVNSAWEAHKIRNRVAHSGSKYVLSRGEAERVIELYEKVFKEFYYV